MRHTVLTENNINATIQIPYEKLQTKNPHFKCQSSSDFSPQILLTPMFCQANCCTDCKRDDDTTKNMIRQLEYAYRDDVDELNRKISTVQGQRNQSRAQLQKTKILYNQIILQRQKMMKQLQKHEKMSKIMQNQHGKSLQNAQESFSLELNNALGVRSSAFELQMAKKQEAIAKLHLQVNVLKNEQRNLRNQIQGLKTAFEIQNRNWLQRENSLKQIILLKQKQIENQLQSLNNKGVQILRLNEIVSQIQRNGILMKSQLQDLRNVQIPKLQKIVQEKERQVQNLIIIVQGLQKEKISLNQLIQKRGLDINNLENGISKNSQLIISLKDQIRVLKQEKGKICQQRVSRLIQRQSQLDCLEIEILNLRKQNHQLLGQLNVQDCVIIEKQRTIQQFSKQIEIYRKVEISMNEQINNLYVQKSQQGKQFDVLTQKIKHNFQEQISEALKSQKNILDGEIKNRQQIISNLRADLENQRKKNEMLRIQIQSHRSLLQTEVINHLERQEKIKKVLLLRQSVMVKQTE